MLEKTVPGAIAQSRCAVRPRVGRHVGEEIVAGVGQSVENALQSGRGGATQNTDKEASFILRPFPNCPC